MSIYNAGVPTMPMYDVTRREFGEMMTPEDQIMWLYWHQKDAASTSYVDAANKTQDDDFTDYKRQMLVTLDRLRRDIEADIDVSAKIGTLWTCQKGLYLDSKEAVRWIHKDLCAPFGLSVEAIGTGNRDYLQTVEEVAESGLSVFGLAYCAGFYSSTGNVAFDGARPNGYPYDSQIIDPS